MAIGSGKTDKRGDLARFIRKISDERGLDLSSYRPTYVERRIAARMRVLDVLTYARYARYLDKNPDEYTKLLETITINVTEFFRDEAVYRLFVRKVIPRMVAEKQSRRQRMLRAWSAGCATGEEPFSITMSFLSVLEKQADDFMLSVLGTDIDETALDVARRAEYSKDKLAHIPPKYQKQYLEIGSETFTIRPEVAKHVRFKPLNLFEDRPLHVVDVIFCRNVFIYFTREQQARVMERFWSALHRGGYLVLGKSEKLAPAVAARLELVDGRERIYRKP